MHAAVADFGGQTVACGRQEARPFELGIEMVLGAVDEWLRMLDPETNGEGLGLQQDFPRGQQPVDVARRVAGGQNHGIGRYFRSIGSDDPADVVSGDEEIDDLGLKPDLAASIEDRGADGLDHVWQEIGTDVRVGVGQDLFGGSVGDKNLVNPGNRTTFGGTCVEFSVGKRTCAALTEAIVRLLDHPAFAQQRCEVETPRAGILAAFQQNWLEAVLQAAQRGKHSCGSATDDNHLAGICRQRRDRPVRDDIRRKRAIERHIQAELDLDGPLAGIDRVLAQLHSTDAGNGHPQFRRGSRTARGVLLGLFEGEHDIDGFDQRLHGAVRDWNQPRIGRLMPASSTLTKVTRVEKIG